MRTLVVALAGALLVGIGVAAAPSASADYVGARWETNRVCVTTGNVDNAQVLEVLRQSVRHLRYHTKLRIPMRRNCWRAGFKQRVNVVDGWYGRNGWAGINRYPDWEWGPAPTSGPWTNRGWTWTYTGMAKIRINLSYVARYSKHDKRHVVYHELLHAMGLTHVPDHWRSVMASYKWSRAQWWDRWGTDEHPGINRIYRNG